MRMNVVQRPIFVEMGIQPNVVKVDQNVVLILHDRSVLLQDMIVVAVLVILVIRKKEGLVVGNPAVRVQRDVKQVNVFVRSHFVGQDLVLNVVRHLQKNRAVVLDLTTLNQDVTSIDSRVVRMEVHVKPNIIKLAVEPGAAEQWKAV